MMDHHKSKQEIKNLEKTLTPGYKKTVDAELKDAVREKLNESHKDNERLKFGYKKKDWGKIKKHHDEITIFFKKTIPNFVTDTMALGMAWDSEEGKELFEKYNKVYKNFIRKDIINTYPGASGPGDAASKKREHLLNLFKAKVEDIFKKS